MTAWLDDFTLEAGTRLLGALSLGSHNAMTLGPQDGKSQVASCRGDERTNEAEASKLSVAPPMKILTEDEKYLSWICTNVIRYFLSILHISLFFENKAQHA